MFQNLLINLLLIPSVPGADDMFEFDIDFSNSKSVIGDSNSVFSASVSFEFSTVGFVAVSSRKLTISARVETGSATGFFYKFLHSN